jgi:aromatic ring-opening dioxygenase LigB subunit
MVRIEGVAHLHEHQDSSSTHFPEQELKKIKSSVRKVGDDIFHETVKGEEVPLDSEVASKLEDYVTGDGEEYELWDRFGRSVDLYNPDRNIAVEIEKTEKKLIWKNLIKFSRGPEQEADERIDFGCVIVPVNYPGGGNVFSHAANALEFTSPLIPIQDIVIIGYRDPRNSYSAE